MLRESTAIDTWRMLNITNKLLVLNGNYGKYGIEYTQEDDKSYHRNSPSLSGLRCNLFVLPDKI